MSIAHEQNAFILICFHNKNTTMSSHCSSCIVLCILLAGCASSPSRSIDQTSCKKASPFNSVTAMSATASTSPITSVSVRKVAKQSCSLWDDFQLQDRMRAEKLASNGISAVVTSSSNPQVSVQITPGPSSIQIARSETELAWMNERLQTYNVSIAKLQLLNRYLVNSLYVQLTKDEIHTLLDELLSEHSMLRNEMSEKASAFLAYIPNATSSAFESPRTQEQHDHSIYSYGSVIFEKINKITENATKNNSKQVGELKPILNDLLTDTKKEIELFKQLTDLVDSVISELKQEIEMSGCGGKGARYEFSGEDEKGYSCPA